MQCVSICAIGTCSVSCHSLRIGPYIYIWNLHKTIHGLDTRVDEHGPARKRADFTHDLWLWQSVKVSSSPKAFGEIKNVGNPTFHTIFSAFSHIFRNFVHHCFWGSGFLSETIFSTQNGLSLHYLYNLTNLD